MKNGLVGTVQVPRFLSNYGRFSLAQRTLSDCGVRATHSALYVHTATRFNYNTLRSTLHMTAKAGTEPRWIERVVRRNTKTYQAGEGFNKSDLRDILRSGWVAILGMQAAWAKDWERNKLDAGHYVLAYAATRDTVRVVDPAWGRVTWFGWDKLKDHGWEDITMDGRIHRGWLLAVPVHESIVEY